MLLSSVNVYLRDTQHLIEVVLTAWFWACPIVYPYQTVEAKLGPHHLTWVYLTNPMTPLVLASSAASTTSRATFSTALIPVILPQHGYLWYAALVADRPRRGVVPVPRRPRHVRPARGQLRRGAVSVVSDFAVDVRNVSKRFRLAHGQYNSLKERLIHGGKRQNVEDFWALDEVSLTVRQGETVGILGRNGSGKSTLLKCICGVLQPTRGEVAVRGKLAGLLELGAGFQQDLTGRENIYLNGSLLGMSKREVDQRLRRHRRLLRARGVHRRPGQVLLVGHVRAAGFAVAVNVDPDVLVVDEVLAVGDERFQRKCIDRIDQFQREGRTILLVTHAADSVRAICDRGVVLSHGRLVAEGEPGEVTRIFRERLMAEGAGMSIVDPTLVAVPAKPDSVGNGALPDAERPVRFRSVHRIYSGDNSVAYMRTGDDLTIRVEFEALYPTEDVVFSLEIRDSADNSLMRTDTSIIGVPIDASRGTSVMHFGIVGMPLLDGSYSFALGIQSRGGVLYDWQEPAGTFEVMNPGKMTGMLRMDVHAALISSGSDARLRLLRWHSPSEQDSHHERHRGDVAG